MGTIDANGLRIGYEVAGEGPTLVLLHGATGSGRDHFAAQRPVLERSFRCYLPDARGHATTRWDPSNGGGLTTDDLVDDVASFIDELALGPVHLLGYSMGGMTALHLAVRDASRLESLVLVSISTEREPRLSAGRALMNPARIDRADPIWAAQLAARHDPVQGEGAWRRLLPAIVGEIEGQRPLSPGELRSIEVPVLVVVGDRDPLVPVDQAHALARQVRRGRLLVLPGGGHDVLAKRPGLLNQALLDFYRDIGTLPQEVPA
jgi:pimeloyl-ACP methyl ester carboxylesterase